MHCISFYHDKCHFLELPIYILLSIRTTANDILNIKYRDARMNIMYYTNYIPLIEIKNPSDCTMVFIN